MAAFIRRIIADILSGRLFLLALIHLAAARAGTLISLHIFTTKKVLPRSRTSVARCHKQGSPITAAKFYCGGFLK
jgi:hypothetical protein